MSRTSTLPIPAVHIQQPERIPSLEEVRAKLDPADMHASEITALVAVLSGRVKVSVERFDWHPAGGGSQMEATIEIEDDSDDPDVLHITAGCNPEIAWSRLTELASAASVAAHRLKAMLDGGTWI